METTKTIVFKAITPAQAALDFPGCITEELQECLDQNAVEPDYCQLGVRDGKLYSANYEISWYGWSVWDGSDWRDLADADYDFYKLLEGVSDEGEEDSDVDFSFEE